MRGCAAIAAMDFSYWHVLRRLKPDNGKRLPLSASPSAMRGCVRPIAEMDFSYWHVLRRLKRCKATLLLCSCRKRYA